MPSEKILVTFSTPAFWVRQQFLNLSAIYNRTVDRTEQWNPRRLAKAGFHAANPAISLKERGAGYWSWKPFIIEQALKNASEGDVVLYSDVGRMKVLLLRTGLEPFLRWMDAEQQDCIPGVRAPWLGPVSKWARRDTLEYFSCAESPWLQEPPMQASFSIWRKTPATLAFVTEWKECCLNRMLVSDDPNPSRRLDFPDFITQYGDQTLLSLLAMKKGLKGLIWETGAPPPFMEKSPEDWLRRFGEAIPNGPANWLIAAMAKCYLSFEVLFRERRVD